MSNFKIRDLIVTLRPGLQTPQRPNPLEECGDDVTFVCALAPATGGGGGCDDDSCGDTQGCGGCTDTCGEASCICTDTCGDSCLPASCGPCSVVTCGNTCGPCSVYTETCGFTPCARSVLPKTIAQLGADDLDRLKKQLQSTMKRVNQREEQLLAAGQKPVEPQTVEQIDALEEKLSEAMQELRSRRAEILKVAKPSGGSKTE
jgi:hypothetical protein